MYFVVLKLRLKSKLLITINEFGGFAKVRFLHDSVKINKFKVVAVKFFV